MKGAGGGGNLTEVYPLFTLFEPQPQHKTFIDFSKTCRKIQVSLQSEKNNACFKWRPVYCTLV